MSNKNLEEEIGEDKSVKFQKINEKYCKLYKMYDDQVSMYRRSEDDNIKLKKELSEAKDKIKELRIEL